MPSFPFSEEIAAGAVLRPLEHWHYERVPVGGIIKLMHYTTAAGVLGTFISGTDTLLQRTQISAGSPGAGQTPNEFAVPPIIDEVAAGDKLDLEYENTTGGPLTVDGIIHYQW